MIYDVAIIGGGPAGLSAALILGRCRRKVVLFDDGKYRNAHSHEMHGFLTRDGIPPATLRQIAQEQLQKYETVEVQNIKVVEASKKNKEFHLVLENGHPISSQKLLIATGLFDEWPKIPGCEEIYGTSIFHCPYCDGWELRDQPLAVFAKGDTKGGSFALELTLWSKDIVLCSNGPSELSDHYRKRLDHHRILVREEPLLRVENNEGILERILFEQGEAIHRRAIFFNTKSSQRSDLAAQLGCEFDEKGGIKVGKFECTNIPGLFVAGDASRDVFQAIVAASEGVEAAIAINTSLIERDLAE